MEPCDARLIHAGSRSFAIFPREALTADLSERIYIDEVVTQDFDGHYGVIGVNARRKLSPQQTRVLTFGAIGLSEAETSREISTTEHTVTRHRDLLFGKLAVSDMVSAESESFNQNILEVVQGLVISDPLSDKQAQTLRLAAQGYTVYQIGRRMYISENTVRTHVKRTFDKLGVYNMAAAVLMGRLYGYLPGTSKQQNAAA